MADLPDDVIERICREVCRKQGFDPSTPAVPVAVRVSTPEGPATFGATPRPLWTFWRDQVRQVVAAMQAVEAGA